MIPTIPVEYLIIFLTTKSVTNWQPQPKVRCSSTLCLGRHTSCAIEDKIQNFWNDHPFQLGYEIVRNVLTNGNISTGSQLVQLEAENIQNETVFSNFYGGNMLSSVQSTLETFNGNITTRRRKKTSFCLALAYDGQRFCGWQRQPQNMKLPSVQEVIENAVEHAFVENGRPDIRVSGRTDSGVHAIGQVARLRILSQRAMNDSRTILTTNDVFNVLNVAALESNYSWRCLSVATVSDKFHPTFNSKSRSYVYAIDANAVLDLIITILPSEDIQNDAHVPQNCYLDTFQNLLNAQLKSLVGKELDYFSLSYGKVKTETTFCCLEHAKVVIGKAVQSESRDKIMLLFEFTGNRFLRRMVRMLVGTCMHHAILRLENMTSIDFDLNQLPNDDTLLFDLCHTRERVRSVKIAPPGGLIFISANMTIR